jgi:chorismate mutase
MNLDEIRHLIDETDQQIIDLLIKRYDLVLDVKKYKQLHQLPVLDSEREKKIYHQLDDRDYAQQLKKIYELIMSLSKDMQSK